MLSLQLACRYFADFDIFIAESWCFGALVISLYLLTWGKKTNVLCNIYYICTHINACSFGFVLFCWLALKSRFWFPVGCSVSDAISFSILICSVASSSFGSMCRKHISFNKSTCLSWNMEITSHSVLLCGLYYELRRDLAVQVASLFASDRGAVDILQELQECDLWLWHEFAKFV